MKNIKIGVPAADTISVHGAIEEYNVANDNISLRSEKLLERQWAADRKIYQVTTSDDPVMQELIDNETGTVYATDAILAVLMTSLKSSNSWDVLVTVRDGKIFFDKRDDSNFDWLSVNESSGDAQTDEDGKNPTNSLESLSKEATFMNYNFSQQVLHKDPKRILKFPNPNPFQSSPDERVASVAYKYRSWNLGDNIKIVARTEVDGYVAGGDRPLTIIAKALNQYDSRITGEWRKTLETRKASVFVTELKNNGCKIAKWLVQAHLAGADLIKLGYVTRVSPKDAFTHSILAITTNTQDEFAREAGADFSLLWGTLKHIVTSLLALGDGHYLLLKDPNKKQLLIHAVPEEDFRQLREGKI